MSSLFQLPANIFERGLLTIDTALRTVQSAIQAVSGQGRPESSKSPPMNGPTNVDTAVAEFANRVARIARFTPWEMSELGNAFQEIVAAARHSFSYLNPRDPRNISFPLQLALSFGTLMTEMGLRGLASYEVVGSQNYHSFVSNVYEMFTEIQIFTGLEYRALIEKYEARLARVPNDDETR